MWTGLDELDLATDQTGIAPSRAVRLAGDLRRVADMGMYVAVRGWVELDFAQRQEAERIIEADADGHYSGGWGWPAKPFNWTLYLFYGGDVRNSAIENLRTQVEQLASLAPVDEDNDLPRGLFMVTDELGEARWWQVRDGAVLDTSAPGFHWLAT